MDPDTIIATFYRIRTTYGDLPGFTVVEIEVLTARELGLTSAEVHAVMVDKWTLAGADNV